MAVLGAVRPRSVAWTLRAIAPLPWATALIAVFAVVVPVAWTESAVSPATASVTLSFPVKLLLATNCGTFVVSTFTVTFPVPPNGLMVMSVPAVICETPPAAGVAQAHAVPLQASTCPVPQVAIRPTFPLLATKPPPVLTPVSAPGNAWPEANVTVWSNFVVPFTSSLAAGVVVPIPTLPAK